MSNVDAMSVLSDLKIDMNRSVHLAIQRVGDVLSTASSKLNAANRIIMRLGGSPQKEEKHAELVAKRLRLPVPSTRRSSRTCLTSSLWLRKTSPR